MPVGVERQWACCDPLCGVCGEFRLACTSLLLGAVLAAGQAGTGVTRAQRAGHRAGFCGTPVALGSLLLHSPVVTLAWGTKPCKHPKPWCCTEKSSVCLCKTSGLGLWVLWKRSEQPVMWAKDLPCNLCGKLIAVDYKPSAILLICNTGQQPFKRAVLHPAPQAQYSHIIEQHGTGLFKKQIGCTSGKGQGDWRER